MLNYHKNKLINKCLSEFYNTFSLTLDTKDFVPDKFNNKILKYIMRNLDKTFKKINREDRKYQRYYRKKRRKGHCTSCNKSKIPIVEISDKLVTHVPIAAENVATLEPTVQQENGVAAVSVASEEVLPTNETLEL